VNPFASKMAPVSGADGAAAALKTIERLEQLQRGTDFNADHAGSTWIWDARLRTAEDLERQSAQLRALTRQRCQRRRSTAIA